MGKQIIPIYKRIYVGLNPNYHNLPSEYTEVAWLGSTGTQWIQTNYQFKSDTDSFDITYEYISLTNYQWAFGCYGSNYSFGITNGESGSKNLYYSIAYSKPQIYNTDKHHFIADSSGVTIDDTYEINFCGFTSYNLYYFGCFGGNESHRSSSKIYEVIHKRNGVEILHFIPCFRNSDVAGGMYDIVNNVFYPNANQQGENFNVGTTIPKYITYSTLPTYVSGADVNTQRIIKTLPSYVKEETELQAGFYSATDELLLGWNESGVDVETDYTSTTYKTGNSGYKIITDYNSTHSSNPITKVIISNNVNKLGNWAFEDCSSLTSVTIPNSVTSIGNCAFYYCRSLTSVTIGSSVTDIGCSAFENCSSLTSVTIGSSVTSIGSYVFYNCSLLTSIIVDENNQKYKSIDGNLYSKDGKTLIQYSIGKKDTSFTIPSSVISIGDHAFYGCKNLTQIIIPNSVTSIGSYAFNNCNNLQYNQYDNALYLGNQDNPYLALIKASSTNITSCVINNQCKIISYLAFSNCSNLRNLTIPSSVTSIENSAFYYSGITSITIPDNVTIIRDYTFYNCSSLTSVVIGSSVTSINDRAFSYCNALTSITCRATTPPTTQTYTFQYVPANCAIYVPSGSVNAYKNATNWSSRANYIQAIPE